MPTLKAPKQVVFLVSLILSILAWITAFTDIAYIGGHPSILMTFAYIVLALGCFFVTRHKLRLGAPVLGRPLPIRGRLHRYNPHRHSNPPQPPSQRPPGLVAA